MNNQGRKTVPVNPLAFAPPNVPIRRMNPQAPHGLRIQTKKTVQHVPRSEFFREHPAQPIALKPIKERIDKALGTPQRRQLFWSCFRNFMTAKISKTEFTRIVKQQIRIPAVIPLFNYFVRSLLYNSRLSHRDPPITKTFEEYFNTFHRDYPAKYDDEDGFGTLVANGLIDFTQFSCEPTTTTFNGIVYGGGKPYHHIITQPYITVLTEKITRGVKRHEIRTTMQAPTLAMILLRGVEIYLKQIISKIIDYKTTQNKDVARYRHENLRGIRVGSQFINSFKSTEFPGVLENYFYYKDEVLEAVDRQLEMGIKDRRTHDCKKLDVLKRLESSKEDVIQMKRYGQIFMKTNEISKYYYPEKEDDYLVKEILAQHPTLNKFGVANKLNNTNGPKKYPPLKYEDLMPSFDDDDDDDKMTDEDEHGIEIPDPSFMLQQTQQQRQQPRPPQMRMNQQQHQQQGRRNHQQPLQTQVPPPPPPQKLQQQQIRSNNNVFFQYEESDLVINDEGLEKVESEFFEELEPKKLDVVITPKDFLDVVMKDKILLPYPQKVKELLLNTAFDMI